MLSIGIVGLPNVGKSSLFNVLSNANILVANYPFATIEPNIGTVSVPDERLINLAQLYNSEKIVPATIKFVDIAGLVKGASLGEGLGNQFLSHIRSCQCIIQVVRVFKDSKILRENEDNHGPKIDIETINTELVLSDLSLIEKKISKVEKEFKANPKLKELFNLYILVREKLNENIPLWEIKDIDKELLNDLGLLTLKPVIYLFNLDEEDLNNQKLKNELEQITKPNKTIFLSAKFENDIKDLSDNEKLELLNEYQQKESGLVQLINASYDSLGLQSFLTAGPKEVRAWTIKKGTTAQEAAGVIHQDFKKGFIAAEIINYMDLINCGSFQNAKSLGLIKKEGRDYIMQDGDVVEFRFNV